MIERAIGAIRSQVAGMLQPSARPASGEEVDDGVGVDPGGLSLTPDMSPSPGRSHSVSSQAFPPLGLRGGLGKTLLVAFLLLAIVPLSLLAFFTYNQIQRDTRQRMALSLEEVVALKSSYLVDWVEGQERELMLVAEAMTLRLRAEMGEEGPVSRADTVDWLASVQATDPAFSGLMLLDQKRGVLARGGGASVAGLDAGLWSGPGGSQPCDERLLVSVSTEVGAQASGDGEKLVPVVCYSWDGWTLVGLLNWDALRQVVSAEALPFSGSAGDVQTSLITQDGVMVLEQGLAFSDEGGGTDVASLAPGLPLTSALPVAAGVRFDGAGSEGVARLLEGESGSGAYTNLAGVPVFGAYRWLPELGVGILAEQPQVNTLGAGDTLTALVVGATLGVALLTAAIAAMVTRRITRPIVQLTRTAAWMARGDLDHTVPVTRKDEIGVLARAFNHMASELRVLYANLEAKVADRTRQLEEASQYTRYYLMQLAISAEVARVASSIRDLDLLLNTVADLIDRAFELHQTTIYLIEEGSSGAVLCRAGCALLQSPQRARPLPPNVEVGGPTLVGRVAADGVRRVVRVSSGGPEHWTGECSAEGLDEPWPYDQQVVDEMVKCEMALPLRVRDKILGVLDLQSVRPEDFGESDQVVYRSLADQISIAIENARAYAVERETVERLRELDRIQAEFLTNMSHALRTPLNSVIGFSRVMLKELDGPLTELQRTDLDTIYEGGRQLLGLINDMLELSHLDLGVAPFSPSDVDLGEMIEGVLATTKALARGKQIQIYADLPPVLPTLYTDGKRVRQVILALLSNAVKFTDEGSIRLAVSIDAPDRAGQEITISVSDTGKGITELERQALFTERGREGGDSEEAHRAGGDRESPGFGLAISKRVVEKLGGRIWVESQEGVGSTFTFTLPIHLEEVLPARGAHTAGGDPLPVEARHGMGHECQVEQ